LKAGNVTRREVGLKWRGGAWSGLGAGALAFVLLAGGPACAGAMGAPKIDRSKAETVIVTMVEYRFEPDRFVFRRGIAYRLHLDNRGRELHEFTAPAFFKAVQLGNPEILSREGQEVVLQPGEQKDVYFVPLRAGRYPLTCADHDWEGMIGDIIVQ
jgi:uncharacterized cupredoxin-like copper-binding protein